MNAERERGGGRGGEHQIVCMHDASFVCKFRSNIHFILWIYKKCVRALWLDRIWPRIELSCELNFFPSFAILHSFIHPYFCLYKRRLGIRFTHVCVTSMQNKRKEKAKFHSKVMKIQQKKRTRTAKYHTNILNTLNQREFILSGRPKHMANRHTHTLTQIQILWHSFCCRLCCLLVLLAMLVRNIMLFAYWNWKSTTNICELKNWLDGFSDIVVHAAFPFIWMNFCAFAVCVFVWTISYYVLYMKNQFSDCIQNKWKICF